LIIGGPAVTQASIEFYAASNGKMNLNSFNGNGVNINGPLAVSGGISFTGSLTLAGGQAILGANGSFFIPYDGSTGNLIIRSTTLNDTLSKIRFHLLQKKCNGRFNESDFRRRESSSYVFRSRNYVFY
jgi:hypothetical protein